MSQNHTIHDVTGITIKRSAEDDQHWTCIIVEHTNWGYNADNEYAQIKMVTEITCHHNGSIKLPVKITSKRTGA